MPSRRILSVLAGVGVFLSLIVIERAEAPHAFALTRPASAAGDDVGVRPVDALREAGARIGVRAPAGPLVVATDATRLVVHARPGGARTSVPARNPWAQPLAFPVVGRSTHGAGRQWLRVLLGVRPNGVAGWVLTRQVHVSPVRDRIVVDLSARTLRRWHDRRLTDRLSVAVGADASPTPPGRFFVWARLDAAAGGPYGTFVLGLSGYPGDGSAAAGNARLAIHGTADPGDLGLAVSHGCIRVLNEQLRRLLDVPMGTLVTIRP